MNKYIAWNNETNRLDPCWYPLVSGDKEISIIGMQDNEDHEQLLEDNACEIYKSTGKTDIHGQDIYYDFHIVKFKWVKNEKEYIFIGVITFDEDELRAEIDIFNYHDEGFCCLWYDCLTMFDFEIIGNVKENPELI